LTPIFILKKSNSLYRGLNLKMKERSSIFWKRLKMTVSLSIQTVISLRKMIKVRMVLMINCLNMCGTSS
jgi:hypothetical protein